MFFFDQLNRIEALLHTVVNLLRKEAMTLDELKVKVTNNTSLEQSAITLIQGLAAQLGAAATDPAKVQALADQLDLSAAALAAAITANTTP